MSAIVGIFIPHDGFPQQVELDPEVSSLTQLQAAVGGSVEAVGLDQDWTAWMNDEALIYGLPVNIFVTHLLRFAYGYPLLGDALLLGSNRRGEEASLPKRVTDQVRHLHWLVTGTTLPAAPVPLAAALAERDAARVST